MMIITQMGYEYVKIISVENGHISEQYIIEGKNCMYEDTIRYDEPSDLIEGSEYLQYSEVDDDQLIYMYYL